MNANDSVKLQPRIVQRNAEQWFSERNANKIQPELFDVLKKEFSLASIEKTADDINNLLALIIGNISLAKMELNSESSAVRYLVEAEKACIRTKAFTQKLVNIPAKAENSNKAYSINQP